MNDGFHHKSNTLPSDGRDARGRSPIIKQSATGSKVKSCSSGAVRIDLSTGTVIFIIMGKKVVGH